VNWFDRLRGGRGGPAPVDPQMPATVADRRADALEVRAERSEAALGRLVDRIEAALAEERRIAGYQHVRLRKR
jgi:hypothetical protein